MIPTLNLLPWREAQRRRRNRLFSLQLGGTFAAAWALIGAFVVHFEDVATGQRARNALLEDRVAEFERRVEEVERLRQRGRALTGRIEFIQALEPQRGSLARVLEAMVNTLPVGVHYQAVALRGDVLALRGVTASSQGVPALMRNLQQSPWFAAPTLLSIQDVALDASAAGSGAMHGQGSAMHGQGSAMNGQGSAFSMTVLRMPGRAALVPTTVANSATGD